MKRPRPIALLALTCCLLSSGAPGRSASGQQGPELVGTITGLFEPMTRQVIQRRDNDVGLILFVGSCTGNVDGFQATSTVQPGMSGTPVGWTFLIDVTINGGYFFAHFLQPAGGFYDIQIRPTYHGKVGQALTVSTVGVGEVFITAGQSNSTSNGTPTGFLPSPLVSCFDDGPSLGVDQDYPGAYWRYGVDPQPSADFSTGGSVWPTMATYLADAFDVPIGLYAVGIGGSSVEQWQPALGTDGIYFERLYNAILYFNVRGGARGVLWDQGETDYFGSNSPANYQAKLANLIDQSRQLTGVPIKWMVAKASTCLTDNLVERVGIENAQAAVVDYVLTFPGPDTDSIGLTYRIYANGLPVHFNADGLELLGGYWAIYIANMPGFLAPGDLPPL